MQAMVLANGGSGGMADTGSMGGMDMGGAKNSEAEVIPPIVDFPYGFPSPGRYRIFIQMKHGSTVETGIFDAEVR